jgi:hypothetical protein
VTLEGHIEPLAWSGSTVGGRHGPPRRPTPNTSSAPGPAIDHTGPEAGREAASSGRPRAVSAVRGRRVGGASGRSAADHPDGEANGPARSIRTATSDIRPPQINPSADPSIGGRASDAGRVPVGGGRVRARPDGGAGDTGEPRI